LANLLLVYFNLDHPVGGQCSAVPSVTVLRALVSQSVHSSLERPVVVGAVH